MSGPTDREAAGAASARRNPPGLHTAAPEGRTCRRRALLVLVFALSLPAVTPRIYASDEVQYFAYLRLLWFDHDVSFENEYRAFEARGFEAPGFHETFLERETATGRRINFGTIGCALLWSPFYAVADLLVRGAGALGQPVVRDGFGRVYVGAVAFGSAFYGFLAVLLSAHVAGRVTGRDVAPAVAVWLGTPLVFYMYVAPPMSHACSAFAVAAFVATWLHVRERWTLGGMISLGVLAALMAMVREQDAFFVAGPALDLGVSLLRRARGHQEAGGATVPALLGRALAGGVAAAVVYTPQALAYLALNGRIGPSQLVSRKMDWNAPHALQVLASPQHGFLVWTPLAALAITGLVVVALGKARADVRARGRLGVALLAAVALQIYVAGSVESWTVAGAFGQRRFVALTAVLAIGLGALYGVARTATARAALAIAVVLCTWWNIGLIAQFGTGLMDRQRLEPARNAWNTFVVLPARGPELAWRYLFARSSFYEKQ